MADSFPLPEARLVALLLESVFYGVYIVTVGYTIRFFINKKDYWTMVIHYVLAFTTGLLAVLVTLDLLVGFRQVFVAFIVSKSEEEALAYLQDPTNRDNLYRYVCTPLLGLIAEGVLIYRCAVIYRERRAVIIAPIIFWTVYLVTCTIATAAAALSKSKDIYNGKSPRPFLISAIVSNVCCTTLLTGLIARFFYKAAKETEILDNTIVIGQRPRLSYSYIMRIIIESGVLITTSDALLLITYLSGSNADYPISDALNVVYAIAFNLIIIRAQDRSSPTSSRITSSQELIFREEIKVDVEGVVPT